MCLLYVDVYRSINISIMLQLRLNRQIEDAGDFSWHNLVLIISERCFIQSHFHQYNKAVNLQYAVHGPEMYIRPTLSHLSRSPSLTYTQAHVGTTLLLLTVEPNHHHTTSNTDHGRKRSTVAEKSGNLQYKYKCWFLRDLSVRWVKIQTLQLKDGNFLERLSPLLES